MAMYGNDAARVAEVVIDEALYDIEDSNVAAWVKDDAAKIRASFHGLMQLHRARDEQLRRARCFMADAIAALAPEGADDGA
jgi:hypothetical protein